MCLIEIIRLVDNAEKAISFAKTRGLIKTQKRCMSCKSRMEIQNDALTIDGCRWRCKNSRCRKTKSIRDNSFFSRSNLSMEKIIQIILFWSKEITLKMASEELYISKQTMVDWYRFCRDIVISYFENIEPSNEKKGGVDKIVEIDESVFSKRKYNRGRLVKETWVFGGVDGENKEDIFIEIVPNRTQETLLEVNLKSNPNPHPNLNPNLTLTLTLNPNPLY